MENLSHYTSESVLSEMRDERFGGSIDLFALEFIRQTVAGENSSLMIETTIRLKDIFNIDIFEKYDTPTIEVLLRRSFYKLVLENERFSDAIILKAEEAVQDGNSISELEELYRGSNVVNNLREIHRDRQSFVERFNNDMDLKSTQKELLGIFEEVVLEENNKAN